MENFDSALLSCQLFAGIPISGLKSMLGCLGARERRFSKNSFIVVAGCKMDWVGVVLSGAVLIQREDYWGKRNIIDRIESGASFGEAFVYAQVEELPVSVIAIEDSEILLLDGGRIIKPCASVCSFHEAIVKNLALLLAKKNITLIQKLEHITQTTTREKLLSYLSGQAQLERKSSFDIPFSREELADYLSVERSAMSAALSKMREDGLILYRKNHFELLKQP